MRLAASRHPWAAKVNLKKYLAIDGKWQFMPVLKRDGNPEPSMALVYGESSRARPATASAERATPPWSADRPFSSRYFVAPSPSWPV